MLSATIRPCRQCSKPVRKTFKNWGRNRKGNLCEWFYCNRTCYENYRSQQVLRREKPCFYCQALFIPSSLSKKKFCSDVCWKAAKKATPKRCSYCAVLFTPVKFVTKTGRFISYNAGKTCSDICLRMFYRENEDRKRKIGVALRGSLHPRWMGGISWLSNNSYRGPDWDSIAERARKKVHYQCQRCGKSQVENGRDLDVHHIIPFFNFTNSRVANAMKNLRVLCQECHHIEEGQVTEKQMILPFATNKHGFGHRGHARGERQHSAKLTADKVREIRRRIAAGEIQRQVAREYGIAATGVNAIVKGHTWKHVL